MVVCAALAAVVVAFLGNLAASESRRREGVAGNSGERVPGSLLGVLYYLV